MTTQISFKQAKEILLPLSYPWPENHNLTQNLKLEPVSRPNVFSQFLGKLISCLSCCKRSDPDELFDEAAYIAMDEFEQVIGAGHKIAQLTQIVLKNSRDRKDNKMCNEVQRHLKKYMASKNIKYTFKNSIPNQTKVH